MTQLRGKMQFSHQEEVLLQHPSEPVHVSPKPCQNLTQMRIGSNFACGQFEISTAQVCAKLYLAQVRQQCPVLDRVPKQMIQKKSDAGAGIERKNWAVQVFI